MNLAQVLLFAVATLPVLPAVESRIGGLIHVPTNERRIA
jgi:hypothetical protein